jgi:hypothetical protein
MQTVSRYASSPHFTAPVWQKILNDPIQIALENHTMTWGSLALDDEPLKKWMAQPVVQTYEEPTTRRVRFANEPTDTGPSLKEMRTVTGTSLMHLITPMQEQKQQVLQPQLRSLMHLITPMQTPEPYANPSNICTIIVYNLPRSTTNVILYDHFCQYGAIEQIVIPKNNDPSKGPVGSIKGFAMVRFSNPQESAMAVAMEKAQRTQIEFAKSDRK